MKLLQKTLSRQPIGLLFKTQLEGISKIRSYAFANVNNILAIQFPDEDLEFGFYLFDNSTIQTVVFGTGCYDFNSNIQIFAGNNVIDHIDLNKINENSKITAIAFMNTPWFTNLEAEQMICVANNKILFTNTITKPSEGFDIPTTATILGGRSCARYGDTADSNFTSFIIPDWIEVVQSSVFENQPLTTIVVGSSVRKIGFGITSDTTTTTLIFKQPAGMYIELPAAGSNSGMAYNKTSRELTVYTDNEYIRDYDWAKDNATVTIYPLSQAPV